MESNPAYAATNPCTWGWLGTLLWSAIIAAVFIVTQITAATAYIVISENITDISKLDLQRFAEDGDVLTVSTWSSFFICGLLVVLAVVTKPGAKLRHYLALNAISWRMLFFAVILTLLMTLAIDLVSGLFNRPMPNTVIETYRSADHLLLFWLAVVVAAPVFEELFFRGFLHASIANTRLGVAGAIVIPAAVWAIIHLQYESFEMAIIFSMGMLLGLARWITKSLYAPILIHALNNFISNLQVASLIQSNTNTAVSFLGG